MPTDNELVAIPIFHCTALYQSGVIFIGGKDYNSRVVSFMFGGKCYIACYFSSVDCWLVCSDSLFSNQLAIGETTLMSMLVPDGDTFHRLAKWVALHFSGVDLNIVSSLSAIWSNLLSKLSNWSLSGSHHQILSVPLNYRLVIDT